ncbi:hypothetical protein GJAV_G00033990 [Gymnothorax javanicus]|nr:hypothetical protein GJAV_G00033990 [Gymnothorax javanicus]
MLHHERLSGHLLQAISTKSYIQKVNSLVMELTIKFLTGNTYSLTVAMHTTVGQLKSKIQSCAQVPCAKQRLTTQNGERIDLKDDCKTLQDYGLYSGCTIVVLIVQAFQVFLKNTRNETHTYDVSPGETVQEFKRKVYRKENVPVEQQRLVYESQPLDRDDCTLEYYGVKAGSTIQLLLRLRGG